MIGWYMFVCVCALLCIYIFVQSLVYFTITSSLYDIARFIIIPHFERMNEVSVMVSCECTIYE